MPAWILSALLPTALLIILVFLIYRLRFYSGRGISGRVPFLVGGIFLLGAVSWEGVRAVEGYAGWFIPSAYPVFDAVQLGLGALGVLLVVIGLVLYADHWQEKGSELDERDGKLSMLGNLQHDARQPYHLMELLSIALRETTYHFSGSSGVVFLLNRVRRQFVLAASAGLNKKEIALLEHYPFGRNFVSQSIELGDPILGGPFEMITRDNEKSLSRFHSSLVLPLVSGTEQIGVLLLLAEPRQRFGSLEIKTLSPVAFWLAEKVRSTRLDRELAQTRRKLESADSSMAGIASRLSAAVTAISSSNAAEAFCRSISGLAGSSSAHLIGIRNAGLTVHGDSEPMTSLSENYRTALIDAVDRGKPLIINQEVTSASGHAEIVLSSLVMPLSATDSSDALLFRRTEAAFKVGDAQMKELDIFARLAVLCLKQDDFKRLATTRRKGFDTVLELLRVDSGLARFDQAPGFFMKHIGSVLPKASAAIALEIDSNGSPMVVDSLRSGLDELGDFDLAPGEGGIGRVILTGEPLFVTGKGNVAAHLAEYEIHNRNGFQKLFGERGIPYLMAVTPISEGDRAVGATVFAIYNLDESEAAEYERLLMLACGLYSLRLCLINSSSGKGEQIRETLGESAGQTVNSINNHLAAVLGSAEILARQSALTEQARDLLGKIIQEAERAAAEVRQVAISADVGGVGSSKPADPDIGQNIRLALEKLHVSGDIYMIAGRARDVSLHTTGVTGVCPPALVLGGLMPAVLDRFGSMLADEDCLSIVSYERKRSLFLDISRHRKEFPPVEPVADFGRYLTISDATSSYPSYTFLEQLRDVGSYFAVDQNGHPPAYLSFRFSMLDESIPKSGPPAGSSRRLLAIDDHEIILDLVSAMGQSMGYRVDTAISGEAGIRKCQTESYDIVLTDLAMPDISGLEVAKAVHRLNPEIPIVLITGWDARIDRSRLSELGIREVLHKPFRIEQLTELIESLAKPSI